MKQWKKLLSFIAVAAFVFAGACGENLSSSESGGFAYKDMTERPEDLEMPVAATQVIYPEKPSSAPSVPAQGVTPSVSGYLPSSADNGYTVTDVDGNKRISYTEISDWAYVYVSVENYSSAYGNIKITLNNDPERTGNAAERIAVQAVYYEAYGLGYSPVTVYLGELGEGEQYVVSELGEYLITNKSYQTVSGQSVKDKTIIGCVVFIDSLPSFAPAEDASGTVDFLEFEFLPDGDPKLDDRYVKPIANFAAAEAESGITLDKNAESLSFLAETAGGRIFLPLEKYTSDFAKFSLRASGEAGTEFDVCVRYTMDGATALSTSCRVSLKGGEEETEYDFSDLFPESGGDDRITRYIKNSSVTDIVICPVTTGKTVSVTGVTFFRTVSDGAVVSNVWSSAASDVEIVRAAAGGNAKISYSYYTAWFNFTVSVRKGDNVKKLRLQIYAPDGLTHLGVGISNTSPNNSDGQPSAGTFILRGSAALFNGADTEAAGTLTGAGMKGITESCVYDETRKVYTLTYDFSDMEADSNGKTFVDYTLTSLIFYLNCPCAGDTAASHAFDGKHSLYFLSIDLLTD